MIDPLQESYFHSDRIGLPADTNDHDSLQERYAAAVESERAHDDCERCCELQTLLDEMRAELELAGVLAADSDLRSHAAEAAHHA